MLVIYDLPVSYDESKAENSFWLFVKKGLKDVFGQSLVEGSEGLSAKVSLLPPKSYVKFTDWGARLLESQFKPKLYIESQNILPLSFYKVTETKNPLYTECRLSGGADKVPDGAKELLTLVKDQRQFDEIDLSHWLNQDGFGWIDFEARVVTKDWNHWENVFEVTYSEEDFVIDFQMHS